MRAVASDVTLLLALVASLGTTRGRSDPSTGSAVPRQVVNSTTSVASHSGTSTSEESTSSSGTCESTSESTTTLESTTALVRSTRGGGTDGRSSGTNSTVDRGGNDRGFSSFGIGSRGVGARTSDVSELLASVALGSVGRESTNTDGGAVNSEMTHSTARVALLVVSDLGVGASVRLVTSLTTVEAQSFGRSASGSDVSGFATDEASATAHRERHFLWI